MNTSNSRPRTSDGNRKLLEWCLASGFSCTLWFLIISYISSNLNVLVSLAKLDTDGAVGSFMKSLTRKIRLNDIKHTGTKFQQEQCLTLLSWSFRVNAASSGHYFNFSVMAIYGSLPDQCFT